MVSGTCVSCEMGNPWHIWVRTLFLLCSLVQNVIPKLAYLFGSIMVIEWLCLMSMVCEVVSCLPKEPGSKGKDRG